MIADGKGWSAEITDAASIKLESKEPPLPESKREKKRKGACSMLVYKGCG